MGVVMTSIDQAEPRIPRVFRRLLLNTLVSGVSSSFLWFALTFWVYLETRSVVATGVIGGAFSISSALLGPLFGTFVDRHRKRTALLGTTAITAVCFAGAAGIYACVPGDELLRLGNPWFWLLVGLTLLGSVAGMMRSIALSTCVTLLVPDAVRDRAKRPSDSCVLARASRAGHTVRGAIPSLHGPRRSQRPLPVR